jgi:hypothetical protein
MSAAASVRPTLTAEQLLDRSVHLRRAGARINACGVRRKKSSVVAGESDP